MFASNGKANYSRVLMESFVAECSGRPVAAISDAGFNRCAVSDIHKACRPPLHFSALSCVCVKVRVRVEISPVLFGRLFCLQIGVVSARNLKCFEPPLLDTSCEDGRWICFGSRRGSLEQEGVQPTSSCCCKFWAKRLCHIVVCPMLATHSPPLSCACEGLSPPALLRIRIGMRHLLSARAVPSSFRAPTAERFSRRHGTATHFDHVFAGPRL